MCCLRAAWAAAATFHAKHYTFTLVSDATVTIDLTSTDEDTYLFLLEGHSADGDEVDHDDDGGDGLNSKLSDVSLDAGDYTIAASTYHRQRTGDFDVRVDAVVPLSVEGLDGSYSATVGVLFSDGFTYRPVAAVVSVASIAPAGLTITLADLAGRAGIAGTPTRADTYEVTLAFRQRSHTDTRSFTVTATCPTSHAESLTGDGSCVPVAQMPAACPVTALHSGAGWWGRVDATGEYGSYGSGAPAACPSLSESGRRAVYYSFTVPHNAPAGMLGRITLEPAPRPPSRPGGHIAPPLTAGGSPSATLWKYRQVGPAAQYRVVRVATDTARQGSDPVLAPLLTAGVYLVEIAPTTGTVGGVSFELAVSVPTPRKVHDDVQHVGNTGLDGAGMRLDEFLDARGSLAKSMSAASSDPSDPPSSDYRWLPFTSDGCSIPTSAVEAAERLLNSQIQLSQQEAAWVNVILGNTESAEIDLAQYIVNFADFSGETIPFIYAYHRHDFNWRNLHRVKHHLKHEASEGVWTDSIRDDADSRFEEDLLVLCGANQYGSARVPNSFDWVLSIDDLEKCTEVASAFEFGVSLVPIFDISYSHTI